MKNIYSRIWILVFAVMFVFSGCEEETTGTLFDDLGSFTSETVSQSIKADQYTMKVGVTHRNHTKNSSVKLVLSPIGDTPEDLCSIANDVISFTDQDTIWVDVIVDYDKLADDGFYNYSINIASGESGYIEPMLFAEGGPTSLSFSKYIPLDRTPFLGSYTEYDGDAYYDVNITVDPSDEFGLIVSGGNWDPDASYIVKFNTNTGVTIVNNQFLGVNYPGIGGSDGNVYYKPASSGEKGTYNSSTGEFSVMVNMSLPNYPYNLGDYELIYSPK